MKNTFSYIFFAVVLHDHNVKLGQKLPSYKFYGGNVVCVPVPFFSLPLIFALVAASISHFLTAAITFSPYSSNKIGLICFLSLALALSLLCTSMQTLKLSRKKESVLLLLFYYLLKSGLLYDLPPKNVRVLEIQNFTPAYMRGGRTYGPFCENQNFLDSYSEITKFSYPWYSAVLASRARELRVFFDFFRDEFN